MKPVHRARVVKSFRAEEEDELDIHSQERVNIIRHDVNGWSFIENQMNEKGLVPSTYIEITNDKSSPIPTTKKEIRKTTEYKKEKPEKREKRARRKSKRSKGDDKIKKISTKTKSDTTVTTARSKNPPTMPDRKTKRLKSCKKLISPRNGTSDISLTQISLDSLPDSSEQSFSGSKLQFVSPRLNSVYLGTTQNLIMHDKNSIVLKVYTYDDLHHVFDEKDIIHSLKSFRAIRVFSDAVVNTVLDETAKKNFIPDYRQFY